MSVFQAGRSAALSILLPTYALVASEWLFLYTQPQGSLGSFAQWELFTALAVLPLLAGVPLAALACGLGWAEAELVARPFGLSMLPAACLWTALAFLLLDNFTYTTLEVGVIAAGPVLRFIYAQLLFIGVVFTANALRSRPRKDLVVIPLLLVSGIALAVRTADARSRAAQMTAVRPPGRSRLPNVVLLASDGLQASELSVYGYGRRTTPFLERFKDRSALFENAFTNAARTTGATTALLTSKYPTTSKVLYPPHILTGEHAFQHLPGMLQELGYRNHQMSVRYYADAADLNMLGAFHRANGRAPRSRQMSWLDRTLMVESYLARRMFDRLSERTLNVLGLRQMVSHFTLMRMPARFFGEHSDAERVKRAIEVIESSEGPFFIHLHMLGTHCCSYPRLPDATFAAGESPSQRDLRDDVVLAADRFFEQVVDALERKGVLDETLVVIGSDHGDAWNPLVRLPLLVHFPGQAHRGRYSANVSLLDVAPTVIDVLGLEKPVWMEGTSLRKRMEDRAPPEPIFSTGQLRSDIAPIPGEWRHRLLDPGPPLYGLASFSAIWCDRWTTLDLENGQLSAGAIEGHTGGCDGTALDNVSLRQLLIRHLMERGFRMPVR